MLLHYNISTTQSTVYIILRLYSNRNGLVRVFDVAPFFSSLFLFAFVRGRIFIPFYRVVSHTRVTIHRVLCFLTIALRSLTVFRTGPSCAIRYSRPRTSHNVSSFKTTRVKRKNVTRNASLWQTSFASFASFEIWSFAVGQDQHLGQAREECKRIQFLRARCFFQ